jgi:mannose-6-phosphate isomerase-like protein (cupin superfamily)
MPALIAGIYVLPKGGADPQKPHREDELYYVVRGNARMQIGSEQAEVRTGSVIFVEAELEHRFYNIQEELEVLVFFTPAEQE